jgi:ATP synthase protein I
MPPSQAQNSQQEDQEQFTDTVGKKVARKAEARRTPKTGWFGLGMMGIVGWSVTLPILLSIAAGAWLEANIPAGFSWRLLMFATGVVLGCLNAWYWVEKERKKFEKKEKDNDKGEPDDND